ncbi:MAG: NAD(P)H-dependent oxidoreductase [Desulfarculaceae bacterium]|nr:NAD(P)H-dependent oxidoreductase [Desulfarculaceae bacterium]MCF8048304.1 NAD(P)H-dependent oxidoreductase [Desulfarculaceae bacterium]MCF8064624.1 NAD(P)H-dependent oxidoreductase [Desulfarculaceae bacterium]MCF8096636.1 NAD(P)H-dependent oxidoreductase [Desulfarculaceae bacterium]MCF8123681.1 NAD(P)H-dependent oxidoreductase [Desulfarculaceae bacterium]
MNSDRRWGLMGMVPIAASLILVAVGEAGGWPLATARWLSLVMLALCVAALIPLRRTGRATAINLGFGLFVLLAAAGFWLWPSGLGRAVAAGPIAWVYWVLLAGVSLPWAFGAPPFTEAFAKRTTPEAVWQTDIFKRINRNMTLVWCLLFLAAAVIATLAALLPALKGPLAQALCTGVIPLVLMLGIGLPFTKNYPAHYQRKLGLEPVGVVAEPLPAGKSPASNHAPTTTQAPVPRPIREENMSGQKTIVAVNGSPHGGIGNTSQMIEMLRPTLEAEGLALEVITLHDKEIDYCTGCAVCLEKGKCWIPDEHRGLVKRLLEADGIILASPVYFLHVTAQMKTFIDRSLAWGHKPRDTYKPGLAISVAAAFQEVEVADYLAGLLHVYGAFSVGTLTAMATGPGGFLGKEAVQARAQDLARDLARAVNEKRRYPVTSQDLFFYLHMGWLVSANKDGVMKDDYRHWEDKGFFQGFEKYVNQQWADVEGLGGEARDAWIKQMIAERKAHKGSKTAPVAPKPQAAPEAGPQAASSCRELLEVMPLGFNPQEAGDLTATVQFNISGDEEFVAHLDIGGGKCTYAPGPAAQPDLVVKAPADVWLAVSQGRLDGQAAFMSGKYQTQGDITLLMRFNKLFS